MLKSFNPAAWRLSIPTLARRRDSFVRLVLGVLLIANLIAAWFAFRPLGGSLERLESELITTRQQLVARRAAVERMKQNLSRTQAARLAGDQFLSKFFLDRRTAFSTLEVDLAAAAKTAGISAKERTFNTEPVEGSDTLGIVSINANFEGTYADLIEFVNEIDRSPRLVILEALQAQPLQTQGAAPGALAINLKMYAFYRQDGAL
jgi:Tfp pilus assembly protein PilO